MAKSTDITVEIKPTISLNTATICLKMVELFLNLNDQYWLEFMKNADGDLRLYLARRRQINE